MQDWIPATLESVYSQTYRPLEVLIVDDGSTDQTRSVVETFIVNCNSPNFKIKCISKPNGGISTARNTGLLLASGSLIGHLDADDLLPSYRTEVMVHAIIRGDGDVVFGDTRTFESEADLAMLLSHEPNLEDIKFSEYDPTPVLQFVPSIGQFLVTRNFSAIVGAFDGRLRHLEECEYVTRMRAYRPNMLRTKECMFFYRERSNSIVRSVSVDRSSERALAHQLMMETLIRFSLLDSTSRKRIRGLFLRDACAAMRKADGKLTRECLDAAADGWRQPYSFALRLSGRLFSIPMVPILSMLAVRVRDQVRNMIRNRDVF